MAGHVEGRIIGIARITGEYRLDEDDPVGYRLPIEVVHTGTWAMPDHSPQGGRFSRLSHGRMVVEMERRLLERRLRG